MKNKNLKIGLAAALSGLVATPSVVLKSCGVTCYDPGVECHVDYSCSYCSSTIKNTHCDWMVYSIAQIDDIVNQIKELEHDVVLDKKEFCPYCSNMNIENPELIFKIRFSEEADYHTVRSNIVNEYQLLLEFLTDREKFIDEQNEKIAIIRKMTGLEGDLKIGK